MADETKNSDPKPPRCKGSAPRLASHEQARNAPFDKREHGGSGFDTVPMGYGMDIGVIRFGWDY